MFDQLVDSISFVEIHTKNNYTILAILLAVLVGVYILNFILGNRLFWLGIIPRHLIGLPGIIFAPFLHGHFDHLFFNLIPLLVLSNFLLFNGLVYFLKVTIFISLLCGFLTWLFAKPGVHIGASGLITGYWSLLVCNSYQQGTIIAIILGLLCLYYFAGILLGIFPTVRKEISWEMHLSGFLAGIAACYLFS